MIIKNAKVYIGTDYVETDISFGSHIENIGKCSETGNILDAGGLKLIPALFDVHTHGAVGLDFNTPGSLPKIREYMEKNGILNFFPTTVSDSPENLRKICSDLASRDVPGINLEGPFLSKNAKGAHEENLICPVNINLMKELQALAGGKIRLTTVAPEEPENLKSIPGLTELEIKVSVGHTTADYDTAKVAFEKGATQLTHTFNTMPPLHHRAPGIIPAALETGNVFFEVISDGLHLHPAIVRMLFTLVGKERLVLISDSMAATGLPDGNYTLGSLPVTVKDSVARIENGALAGSTHNLMDMVKSAISFGIPEETAIYCATKTPALSVGNTEIGEIAIGKRADLLLVDDALNIKQVIKAGKIIL